MVTVPGELGKIHLCAKHERRFADYIERNMLAGRLEYAIPDAELPSGFDPSARPEPQEPNRQR